VQYASWPWIFWLNTILAVPIAGACVLFIPTVPKEQTEDEPTGLKAKSLDVIGVSVLTVAFILFIFSLTSASTDGWASAKVLAPLIISVAMIVFFFWYETKLPESSAAL
jgi:hypothetical protein